VDFRKWEVLYFGDNIQVRSSGRTNSLLFFAGIWFSDYRWIYLLNTDTTHYHTSRFTITHTHTHTHSRVYCRFLVAVSTGRRSLHSGFLNTPRHQLPASNSCLFLGRCLPMDLESTIGYGPHRKQFICCVCIPCRDDFTELLPRKYAYRWIHIKKQQTNGRDL
jgi:hypothetical protein